MHIFFSWNIIKTSKEIFSMSKTKIAAGVKRHSTERILGTAALALAAVLISGANAKANTVIVTPTNFASSGWSTTDTRNAGVSGFSSAQPQSGNASYELSVTGKNDKATLVHTESDILSFSDLVGDSNNKLGFDFYKSSISVGTNSAPAYRLYVGALPYNQLVWEAAYNNITPSIDTFQTVDIKGGKFWAYTANQDVVAGKGKNHNAQNQIKTLSDWLTDGSIPNATDDINPTSFTSGGNILGYNLGLGSGIGAYKGYVDNVTFGTTTTNFENVAAAPEPSQWAGLGFTAFGALGLILKARKKKSAVSAS